MSQSYLSAQSASVLSLPVTTPNLSELTKAELNTILLNTTTIITDCDGVLWIDDRPVKDAANVINKFKQMGIQVILYSNTSITNRSDFLHKARSMGFLIELEDIVTTASVVVSYLNYHGFEQKIYLIGSKGLAEELTMAGYRHLGIGPDVLQHSVVQTVENFKPDPEVGAVVVGFDEHFCYTKLLKAASYLNKPSCFFIATNTDERCDIPSLNIVVPGTGAIVRSIEVAARREAVIVGKPYTYILDVLQNEKDVDPKKTMIIGDRTNTDIFLGNKCGFITVLVLTGATTNIVFEKRKTILKNAKEYMPDYYLHSVGDLITLLA